MAAPATRYSVAGTGWDMVFSDGSTGGSVRRAADVLVEQKLARRKLQIAAWLWTPLDGASWLAR
jgi:hypothetical protein